MRALGRHWRPNGQLRTLNLRGTSSCSSNPCVLSYRVWLESDGGCAIGCSMGADVNALVAILRSETCLSALSLASTSVRTKGGGC